MSEAPGRRYAWFVWGMLAYTVAVILWGAYVRATGSGAGCGAHWPLCNGEVVPRGATVETLVEMTHRITSGLAWLGALVLMLWSRRAHPKGHPGRGAAAATLFFMTTEALVGASIVLLEKVADDASLARGGWMAAHLVNTFLLLFSLTLTAWYASGGRPLRLRGQGFGAVAFVGAVAGLLLLGVSGAVTALGDTLFPGTGFTEGMSPTAHLFLQLRIFHPVIGIVAGLVLLAAAGYLAGTRSAPWVRPLAASVAVLFLAQVGLGFLNIALHAPVWLQVVHLLVADLIWLCTVLLGAAALSRAPAPHPATADDREDALPA